MILLQRLREIRKRPNLIVADTLERAINEKLWAPPQDEIEAYLSGRNRFMCHAIDGLTIQRKITEKAAKLTKLYVKAVINYRQAFEIFYRSINPQSKELSAAEMQAARVEYFRKRIQELRINK